MYLFAECSDRRDANVPRMKAFINTLMKFKKENFDRWYGSKQLHLAVLCTLPDYQRRGAGTAHCRWGMDYAKDKEWAITLFASPMGKQLYSHLGFDVKGTVHVQIKGEKEELFISAMTCEKPKGSDEDLSSASHRWCVTS
jgi:GNAT superfamily N-acetyltransferase